MHRDILRHKSAAMHFEIFALIAVAAATALAFGYHYQKDIREVYETPEGQVIEYGKMKEEAPLVIVGTIKNRQDKIQEKSRGGHHWFGEVFYVMDVETIERGTYSRDEITVNIGWGADYAPIALYPPYIKKDYEIGDRIRIYLYYDPEIGYLTPGCWFTIESV